MSERRMTPQQVSDIGKCQSLLPTESDFKGKRGYWRKYRSDGSGRYEWGFKFRPNVDGKRTRAGQAVVEMMAPFSEADSRRFRTQEKNSPRAALRDHDGQIRVVDAALADSTAQRNGWSHAFRVGKGRTERGVDGMLFKWDGLAWWPTGRWCSSAPFTQTHRPKDGRRDGSMILRGRQRDPDGHPWRYVAGSWRRAA